MATIFAQICSDGIVFGTHGEVKLMIDSLTIAQIGHGDTHLAGGSIYNHGQLKRNYMAVGDDSELITPHLYYADLTHPNSAMSEYMEFLKLSVANYAQYHGPDIDKINLTEVPRSSN